MASRFAHKPDPAIKKNVRRARSAANDRKHAHASVVAASLAATLLAWAMFSNQDVQLIAAQQAAASNQAIVTTVTPAQNPDNSRADAAQGPAPLVIAPSSR